MSLHFARIYRLLAANAAVWGLAAAALGQSSVQHWFSAINVQPSRTLSLTVTSTVPSNFRNYYDLFPIEASTNLVDWVPLATLVRTNRSSNAVSVADGAAPNYARRFYRTPTNPLTTPLPPPDGPHRVGVLSRLLTDLSRTNRYLRTNSSFMATVWYPARSEAGVLPGFHSDLKLGTLGFCTGKSPSGLRGHALPDVPLSSSEALYPVVIYSHGDQLVRTDNTLRVENLVSFGFVVVAVDHWNCGATVFPDGRRFTGLPIPNLREGDPLTTQVAANRGQDVRFVLGEIARWNSEDPMLRGRLDTDRIGIFGLSFGGGTTAHACHEEPSIKAGVSLDGGYDRFPIPTLDRPFLILSGGDGDAYMKPFRDAFHNLFDRLTRDAYWIRIKDSIHCDFNDTPWFDAPASIVRTRRALVLDRYVLSFFRKYLRSEDDHFLDGPSAEWPEVDAFQSK